MGILEFILSLVLIILGFLTLGIYIVAKYENEDLKNENELLKEKLEKRGKK